MKLKTSNCKKNIRRYYLFRVFCSMNFVMPIFILFLMDKGLSSFQIFVTQAVYTVTELLLTIPSGAFADKVGRKKTLILSSVVYAGAYLIYSFSGGFVEILIAEIVFAVSSAAFHGTGEAFLYDTLASEGREKQYKKVLGNSYAIQSVVMGICAIAGGWIAKMDLALPYLISALPAAISLIPLMLLDEPERVKPTEQKYWPLIKESSLFVARHKNIRNVLYFISVTTVASWIGFMLYQPLLTGMGLSIEYLGIVMMLMALSSSLGNKLAGRIENRLSDLKLMGVLAGSRALLFVLVYLAGGIYLIAWAVLIDLIGGISSPIVSDWINKYSKTENRATVNSMSSMAGNLSFSLISPFIGVFIDIYSTQTAYLLLAIILGAYTIRQLGVLLISRKAASAA